MRTARSTTIILLLVTIALSSCGRYARRSSDTEPRQTVRYGSEEPSADERPRKEERGILEVVVTDDGSGRAIAGATVRYRGPERGRATTDRRGRVRVSLAPGSYEVDLVKCGKTVVIDQVVSATAVVVEGETARGRLGVDPNAWTARYKPSPTVRIPDDPPWERGRDVTLAIRMEDGCDYSEAPGVSIRGYAWRASDTLRILDTPEKADANGFAPVVVECATSGDASLVVYRVTDPDEQIDLLLAGSGPPAGETWCA